jgi:RNA polymerase sigma-70 factor (ECF subfamily)
MHETAAFRRQTQSEARVGSLDGPFAGRSTRRSTLALDASFSVMYHQHAAAVGAMLRSLVPAAVAEELVQEVFLAVWKTDGCEPSLGTRRGYLYGIARHRAIDWLRSNNAATARDRRWAALRECDPTTEDSAFATITGGGLQQALTALPANQREPILLAFYGGLTYREVAVALDTPEGTVKWRIRMGLKHLECSLTTAPDPHLDAPLHRTGVRSANPVHAHGAPLQDA